MGLRHIQERKRSKESQVSYPQEIKVFQQPVQHEVPKKKWKYNPNFISHKQQEKNLAKIKEASIDNELILSRLPVDDCPLIEQEDKEIKTKVILPILTPPKYPEYLELDKKMKELRKKIAADVIAMRNLGYKNKDIAVSLGIKDHMVNNILLQYRERKPKQLSFDL